MSANDKQVAGDHYKSSIQHWDYVVANELDYFQAQITKYVTRWKKKNGLTDLEKALHFLEKYIELEKGKNNKSMSQITKEVIAETRAKNPQYPYLENIDKMTGHWMGPAVGGKVNHPAPFGYDPTKELGTVAAPKKCEHPLAGVLQNIAPHDYK
jgi:Protein of unknwon function (DUF3310)